MSNSFSPYQTWLGFAAEVTQPSYFELLGLDEAEEDTKTIAAAADRAASRVRRCRPGEQATQWAALLDEIAAAKKCLTDPKSRAEYRRRKSRTQVIDQKSLEVQTTSVAVAPVDPNMYPPGAAPVTNPVHRSTAGPDAAAASKMGPRTLPESYSAPDPQAPLSIVPQPVTSPLGLAMSPAGVPYLQPAEPGSFADPMRPVMPPSPPVPPAMDFAAAMVPAPQNADPMAALPVALPVGVAPLPIAQAILNNSPAAFGTNAAPAAATSPQVVSPPVVNRVAVSPTIDAQNSAIRPVLIGVGVGLVLLVVVGGLVSWNAYRSSQVTAGTDGKSTTSPESPSTSSNESANDAAGKNQSAGISQPSHSKNESANSAMTPKDGPSETKGAAASTDSTPEAPPDSTSAAASPTEGPKPEPMPKPESAPVPAPTPTSTPTPPPAPTPTPTPDPAKTDEIPKPTAEELVKLGRAMQKTRDAIAARDFDKASALIEIASEMPHLPEHQAMLDRLKLLLESVRQYHTAILTSISKLQVGSSFEIGEATVGVVEVRPDKITLRTNGQNRAYSIAELPTGLAAELASQTLADDPTTLALKGAYVLASSRASETELKKAREFIEKASGTVEAAKDLLPLFDDKYDLASKPEK